MPGWSQWDKWGRWDQWGESGGPTWLLRDEFTTDDAAPITSPRTCEPGPGLLVVVDTEDKLSLSGGSLVCTGGKAVPAWGDPGVWLAEDNSGSPAEYAVSSGHACFIDLTIQSAPHISCGFDGDGAGLTDSPFVYFNSTNNLEVNSGGAGSVIGTWAVDEQYKILCVKRSPTVGEFFIINGELVWVDSTAGVDGSGYPSISNHSGSFTAAVLALISLADHHAAWGGDWSEVTDAKTNPASGTAFSCDVDYHVNTTFTHEDTKIVLVSTRFTDVDNRVYWHASGTGLLVIYEYYLGTPNLLYASATFSDGVAYEIDVVHNGSSYKLFVDKVLVVDATLADPTTVAGGLVEDTLATNDIVLSAHPNPALGIATGRTIAPQATDTISSEADCLAYYRNITIATAGNGPRFALRKQTATKYLYFFINSLGAAALYGYDGGLDGGSLMGLANGTFSDDDDVCFVLEGASVYVYADGVLVGSTTSIPAKYQVGSGTMLIDKINSSDVDSMEAFPRNVSSLLPAELR
jgi:hypothetical protein